jgi:hypothetical protein
MFALVAAIAFAVAWFAPRIAHATILPACELREQLTIGPTPDPELSRASAPFAPFIHDALSLSDGGDSCAAPSDEQKAAPCDELTDVPGMAPMSDARGATTIAPLRVRAADGGKIEAVQCSQLDVALHVADEARSSAQTTGAGPGLVAVLLDTTPMLDPAPFPALVLAYPPPSGGPLAGVRRGIEHPPR